MATPRKNPHAVALGRRGGLVKSGAKTKAVRANARRPRPRQKPMASPPRVTAPAQPRARHQARVRARPATSETFGT